MILLFAVNGSSGGDMKKTILLVEDDGVVRDMIRGALEREYAILRGGRVCLDRLSGKLGTHSN
jgi:hypothetical protein